MLERPPYPPNECFCAFFHFKILRFKSQKEPVSVTIVFLATETHSEWLKQKKNVPEAHGVAPKIGRQGQRPRTRNSCLLLGLSSQLWALSMATGTTTLGNWRCPAFVCHLLLIQSSNESMWLVRPNHFLKFCWWEVGGDKYLAFFSLFDAKWSSEFWCSTDSLKKREEKNGRKRNLETFTHLRTSQHFWQNAA